MSANCLTNIKYLSLAVLQVLLILLPYFWKRNPTADTKIELSKTVCVPFIWRSYSLMYSDSVQFLSRILVMKVHGQSYALVRTGCISFLFSWGIPVLMEFSTLVLSSLQSSLQRSLMTLRVENTGEVPSSIVFFWMYLSNFGDTAVNSAKITILLMEQNPAELTLVRNFHSSHNWSRGRVDLMQLHIKNTFKSYFVF